MQIYEIIWKDQFLDKISLKHNVTPQEVEQILFSYPYIRRANKGRVKGEDVYIAYGQTLGGRYLLVVFIYKQNNAALVISARDMTDSERRYYGQQN